MILLEIIISTLERVKYKKNTKMENITAFLISVLAGIATEKGKNIFEKLSGNKTIIQKIEKAFNNALKKWTVNDYIRKEELLHINNRTTLLKQILLEYKNKESIDSSVQELLTLFELELKSDVVAFNFLVDIYLKYLIEKGNQIERKIDNTHEVIIDLCKQYEIIDTKFTKFISLEKNTNSLSNSHFIKKLESEPLYIPRTITSYQNIDNENDFFRDRVEERTTLKELIQKESRIVLLGSAGTGKSTELKEVAIDIAKSMEYYPIFRRSNIDLPADDIEKDLPNEFLKISEKKILFLDGLDEIEPLHFNTFKSKIDRFIENYKDVKVVISCRTNFYELPVNGRVGTLREFNPYYINELSSDDVKNYVIKNYSCNGDGFIRTVYENSLGDLVFNPFFLKLIIDNYKNNQGSILANRVELIREFIEKRFVLDENHYQKTINIYEEKFKALKHLRKVSLSMEVIGTRIIKEEDLRTCVEETEDFRLLKYCTVFKKDESSEKQWKFEHNYFQEFLCAELLSEQSFDVVKSFISYNDYDKVLPTWFNTVAQLISIIDTDLDLFKKLIEWLIKYDAEVLVNVEREKLSISTREKIFIKIFEYYKELKIWIDSNKFRGRDLAYFGQSNKCIKYLHNIIIDSKEAQIARLNALIVLGSFPIINYENKEALKKDLIYIIKEQIKDTHLVFYVINTLSNCGFTDSKTTTGVFEIVREKKSNYVRAAMYKFLAKTNEFESYVNYYLEGYRILKSKGEGRDKISLFDENRNLNLGMKKFKSFSSLKSILEHYTSKNYIAQSYDSNEVLEGIISNCIEVYNKGEVNIFDYVFKLMSNFSYRWLRKEDGIALNFFNKTGTKQKAYEAILELIKNNNDNYLLYILLSNFTDENNYTQIINEYKQGNIKENYIQQFYIYIRNLNIELSEKYKSSIQEQLDIVIETTKKTDWDEVQKKRTQASFNLLFDKEKFKKETLKIFGDKSSLSKGELYGTIETSSSSEELEDLFVNSALDFVRDFAKNKHKVLKSDINDRFKDNVEDCFIDKIYNLIKGFDYLSISEFQIKVIKEWFDKYINIIDFNKVVTKGVKGGFSVDHYYACYLVFFMQRFDFKCQESKLLDMLSFVFEDVLVMDTIQFDYIINVIDDIEKIKNRVIENINNKKIAIFLTYKLHVEFALKNNLNQCYSTIISCLLTSELSIYEKNIIINMFFEYQQDVSELKNNCDEFEIDVQLNFYEKLINTNDISFVIEKLKPLSKSNLDTEILRSINNLLIITKQVLGLKKSIEWIKKNKKSPFDLHEQSLSYFEDIDALPHLITLLKLSYDSSIVSEYGSNRMWSVVVSGLEYLALASENNYIKVTESMKSFIDNNKGKLKDVEFLNRPIETIKEKYYSNKIIKYDMKKAMEKINLLLYSNPTMVNNYITNNTQKQLLSINSKQSM